MTLNRTPYLALAAALGLAVAAPAEAASWTVTYSGWWQADGGGSIIGRFEADEAASSDGIISIDEMNTWSWNWSGNDAVPAFSFGAEDPGASTSFSPSFYVDGTPNQPYGLDDLDQGGFSSASGEEVLDLEFLGVEAEASTAGPFTLELVTFGDPDAANGQLSVVPSSAPPATPEPAAALGLFVVGAAVLGWGRRPVR